MNPMNMNLPMLLAKARREGTDTDYWLAPLPYLNVPAQQPERTNT